MSDAAPSTHELLQLRPQLRPEARIVPLATHDGVRVEVPEDGSFYEIGRGEYLLLSLLDGDTSVAAAIAHLSETPDPLTEQEATSVVLWAIENGIVRADSLAGRDKKRGGSFNPFWLKLPLGNPDRLLEAAAPIMSWLQSPAALLVAAFLIAAGVVAAALNWESLQIHSRGVLTPENGLWLLATWAVLRVIHEFSHAMAAKRYGVTVREAGIVFVLLAPLAYVDVTSSWRLRSKWQRVHIAAAGILTELTMAALCVFGMLWTDSPVIAARLWNVVVAAGAATLLFNANPLMRFDGYYILTDLLHMPNLYGRGMAATRSTAGRLLIGKHLAGNLSSGAPPKRQRHNAFVRIYGAAAVLWRVFICVSLTLAASTLFGGAGVVLAIAGAAAWLAIPTFAFLRFLMKVGTVSPPHAIRAGGTLVAIVVLVGGVLAFAPFPGRLAADGIVELNQPQRVRLPAAGFVRRVLVQDGETVRPGQLLAVLENAELEADVARLESQMAAADVSLRTHVSRRETAAAKAVEDRLIVLQRQLAERRQRLDALTVRAKRSGRVFARNLDARVGTWLEEGDELLTIGEIAESRMLCVVEEHHLEQVRQRLGKPVTVRLPDRGGIPGTLTRVRPQAVMRPPHPALSATTGGPLPVIPPNAEDPDGEPHLTRPLFVAHVTLPPHSTALPGQRGYATIGGRRDSIGSVLSHICSNWIADRLR